MRCRFILSCALVWLFAYCDWSVAQQPPATPMDRFRKYLDESIGSTWYALMAENVDQVTIGTARIAFTASPDGKIVKIRVLSNTSNDKFAAICQRAVLETKIRPIPPKFLTQGRFEDEVSFTVYAK
jgi:hypothetical protein